jgi:hypothetical protein
MTSQRAVAIVTLAALLHFGGAPALAQNAATPPSGAFAPALMPDLVVTIVGASVKCVGGKRVTATIIAAIQNKGTVAPADFSKVTWQIGIAAHVKAVPGVLGSPPLGTVDPELGIPQPIKPGEARTFTLVIPGIPPFGASWPKPWKYALSVVADPKNGVAESSETNNEAGTVVADPCPK